MAYTDIDNPSETAFNTVLYTGNSSTQVINVGFRPDLVWAKPRTSGGHFLSDSIRGGTKVIQTGGNSAEVTRSSNIQSFNSNGYTLAGDGTTNNSGDATVSWNFKAGTSFTNDASSTGIGTIDSSGSFNNDSGFSVVTWTGTGSSGTIKHGMNTVPSVILIKNRDGGHWRVYHHKNTSAPETDFLELSDSDATSDNNTAFNDTAPTSSVFSVGSMDETNKSSENMVAYCFSERKGYFKSGSYIGTGSTNGSTIWTGGKPALLIAKRSSGTSHWLMMDNKRDPFNVADALVVANDNDSESNWGTDRKIDFLSSGFKCRSNSTEINNSGATHIYMCWMESPYVNSSGIPNNAR